jgi:dipeptidyl aminopeptidase/acylaminoacyl peptidase
MRLPAVLLAIVATATPALAQERRDLTAEDYAHAEQFLGSNTASLVFGATVRPTWLPDGRLWYRNTIPEGSEFILVDPNRRRRGPAFDHQRLADALSAVSDTTYSPFDLPFSTFEFADDGGSITFALGQGGFGQRGFQQGEPGRRYSCDIREYSCTAERPGRGGPPDRNASVSPDGRRAVFIRDHNLWMRGLATGAEAPLTTDGVQYYGYATDNAGWTKSDRPVVLWSPDSKKVTTFQHDERGVGDMYLVSTEVGHPTLEAWRYPLPEDSVIFRISRVVIDLDARTMVRFQMPPDQHRSTICDHIRCGGGYSDIEWSDDGTQIAFVSSSRDHKEAKLRVADVATGAVRDVMEEKVDTFFESGNRMVNWHFLPETNEVIWFSERSNWGHLYLYDLQTGELRHQITSGDWNVLQLRRIDKENRTLYFMGAGREPGDPYFQYFYSIGMDGENLRLLTPDSANHTVTLSESGRYFVDSYSTPTIPPVTVVRDTRGRVRMTLEEGDISSLVAAGWQPPIPFTTKARDGETDLYGLMYHPTNLDPSQKYPIINYLYPGPQSGSVGSRSFSASRRDKQAIAELGFVVVEVDAMGTPMRSKSFHEAYYGNMGDNGIPDQITTIEQLAGQNPWMDIEQVGIWGHSGGGFASADAIMRYPDFYDVAVSQAGNHDNRNYEDDWGEKWQGLLEEYPDGSTNYDNQANQLLAENLKGKLLIAHGGMDSNVPPYNTLVVVDKLIEANKEFDFIMFPNLRHGFGNTPYMMRRRWDYFVRHLLGVEPPKDYEFGASPPRPRT